jgi:branched-chain amino acid transport system permease protein
LSAAFFAAGAAWVVGKISLGLRSDYLAIATLGISEIIIYFLKFEEWLTRGVKNVTGLPRPVPYEIELKQSPAFQSWASGFDTNIETVASLTVKLCYAGLFSVVLLVVLYLSEVALRSPWGPDDARHTRQ